MAKEVELKLSLSPHHVESLKLQPLFRSEQIKALGSQTLKNTYYDTPDHLLTQHKVALRIREKGDKLIQTLKSSGTAEAGLHSRNEWEWILQQNKLKYDLLQKAEWPKALQSEAVQQNIEAIFTTDFTRTTWILDTLDSQGEVLKAEIALDQGNVRYQDKKDPICELELELLQGDATELVKFAVDLARHVPLYISDISKAERGYRLHDPEAYQVDKQRPEFSSEDSLETIFSHLLCHELSVWPRHLEAWKFNRDWQHITQALESLRNTDALYESFSEIIPAEPDGAISKLLIKLIRQLRDLDSWRRTAELTGAIDQEWHQQQAHRASTRVDVLLQTAEPGVLALLISQQLIDKSWQKRWTSQHQQQAQQPLLHA